MCVVIVIPNISHFGANICNYIFNFKFQLFISLSTRYEASGAYERSIHPAQPTFFSWIYWLVYFQSKVKVISAVIWMVNIEFGRIALWSPLKHTGSLHGSHERGPCRDTEQPGVSLKPYPFSSLGPIGFCNRTRQLPTSPSSRTWWIWPHLHLDLLHQSCPHFALLW